MYCICIAYSYEWQLLILQPVSDLLLIRFTKKFNPMLFWFCDEIFVKLKYLGGCNSTPLNTKHR